MKTSGIKKIHGSAVLFLLLAVLLMSGCSRAPKQNEHTSFAMGSVVSAKLTGTDAAANETWQKIIGAINELDSRISATQETSDIAVLSSQGTVRADALTIKTLREALNLCAVCKGNVDITLGAVTELWGFAGDSPSLPAAEDIAAALQTKDLSGVSIDEKSGIVSCPAGQKTDLGAFGKGAACDEACEVLKASDISSAVITVGGSVLLYGIPSGKEAWSVGIRDPFQSANDYFAVLTLPDFNGKPCIFVSTSGSYEKTFEENGRSYHHILDPATGYPTENELVSVTVICSSGIASDALSTACFVGGARAETFSWLDAFGAEAVFVFKNGGVLVTEGLRDSLSIVSDGFTLTDDYDSQQKN